MRHDATTILHERGLPVPEQLQKTHTGILLRIFCHAHSKKVILPLAGYDKGKEPSVRRQSAEIKRQDTPDALEGTAEDGPTRLGDEQWLVQSANLGLIGSSIAANRAGSTLAERVIDLAAQPLDKRDTRLPAEIPLSS